MKLRHISLAVAAFLGAAANAYAYNPTAAHDVTVYMSGASAVDNQIAALLDTQVCEANKDYLNFASGKPNGNYWGISCQTNTLGTKKIASLPANVRVLFIKRSAGGSAQGVSPLLANQAIAHLDVNSCGGSSPNWSCGSQTNILSDAGISDVNPEMFRGANTPAGFAPVNPADVAANLIVRPVAAQVFGIPVTKLLRDALQDAEIKLGKLPNTCAPGNETEACMPSLSKAQVTSILAGRVGFWNDVYVDDNGTQTSLVDFVNAAYRPTDTTVHICRRVDGSGTQAQANANFLGHPCVSTASLPAEVDDVANGPRAFLNSGSGDVEKCLADLNDGTNTATAPVVNTDGRTAWAVGVQGTEKNPTNSKNYRFIKIDGVAPTLENVWNGKYFDWAELTVQYPKTGLSANKIALVEHIAAQAANPAAVAALNTSTANHTWGQAGYLALSTNGHTMDNVFSTGNPVLGYTHAPGTSSLDNCRAPALNPDIAPNSGFTLGLPF
jgi:hypothetical protein